MTNIDDGGPAFPSGTVIKGGMSLRDYFAAKAMQAMVNSYRQIMRGQDNAEWPSDADMMTPDRDLLLDMNKQTGIYEGAEEVGSDAYAIADAMLKARNQ
jgi:hypothetical protein